MLCTFKENELKIIQLMKEKVREVHEDDGFSNLQSVSMIQPSTVSLQRRHLSLIFDVSIAVSARVYFCLMNCYRPRPPTPPSHLSANRTYLFHYLPRVSVLLTHPFKLVIQSFSPNIYCDFRIKSRLQNLKR